MRLFAAVELPPQVRAQVFASAQRVLGAERGVKPVAEDHLHVTVWFLGEVGQDVFPPVADAIAAAAAGIGAAAAEVRAFGAFPSATRPRIVWAGVVDPADVLARIEAGLASRLPALGFAREERAFHAHVTVARVRERVRVSRGFVERLGEAAQEANPLGAFPIREVTLFKSELGSQGPRYSALVRCALGPADTRLDSPQGATAT